MAENSSVAAVRKAHEEGKLFAHMFEFYKHRPEQCAAFFAVLNGQVGGVFESDYRGVEAAADGYRGLATTALKKELPVGLWTHMSDVGLLFDGNDTVHVKPVHVSSRDTLSDVVANWLILRKGEVAAFSEIADMQDVMPNTAFGAIDLKAKGGVLQLVGPQLPDQIEKARAALSRFWEILQSMSWDDYVKDQPIIEDRGINEVNLIAHLHGVRGIIVNEDPDKNRANAGDLDYAKRVQAMLCERYPDHFTPETLPIFSYNPNRLQNQLVELTPERLAQPSGDVTAHDPTQGLQVAPKGPSSYRS